MDNLKNSIKSHIYLVDYILKFDSFTSKSLIEWIEPFLESMTDEGAIPYLLGDEEGERYRASPLASSLIWLNEAGLLPNDAINIMQNKLLYLRDNGEIGDKHSGNREKKSEDIEGWSIAEGVSVWSTSLAIIALIDKTKVGLAKCDQYKQSVLWLIRQQKNGEKGWGYQLSENCSENIIMTALALRAIAMALKHPESFQFDTEEERQISSSVVNGFQYLKENINYSRNKKQAYWCFENKKHCAATAWALIALKEVHELHLNPEISTFYKDNLEKGLEYILNSIPNKVEQWEDERIVCEAGAKYNKQKNYYSFSSTLLLDLFALGVSPYHIKVINQISWLLQNTDQWKIQQYDRRQICSFTYVMVLSTIAKWAMLVGQENTVQLLRRPENKVQRSLYKIIGMPIFKNSYVQVVNKSRIIMLWLYSLLLLFLILNSELIFGNIVSVVKCGLTIFNQSANIIIINVVSSCLYAMGVFIVIGLPKLIGKIFWRLKH